MTTPRQPLHEGPTADDWMAAADDSRLTRLTDEIAERNRHIPASAEVVLAGIQHHIEQRLWDDIQGQPPQTPTTGTNPVKH